MTQGIKYDEDGAFIGKWIPALGGLPAELRHKPWDSTLDLKLEYPSPIIDPSGQIGSIPKKKGGKAR